MGRIAEHELERIKQEVSLVEIIRARGIALRARGDRLIGKCPFHEDRKGTLVVSRSQNTWECTGACKTGGTVIDWVMKAEGSSFRLAVEMLRKASPSLAVSRPKTQPKLEPLATPGKSDAVVLGRVVEIYHQTLLESGEAVAYLESRGLGSREMIETFRLGHSNRTLGYRLPQKQVRSGEELREQLQRIGILRGSGHEHFAGSLVIPVFDANGEVLDVYGRKLRSDLRKGTAHHLYLPRRADGRRGVFNLAGLAGAKDVILCEALIDALTFWCAGFRNVTSAYGVDGFTAEMREAFRAHGIARVLIAYDRDETGERAAEALAVELAKDGFEVFRINFPQGMDANAYALKVPPASRSLQTAIDSAEWMAGTRADRSAG